ncbi:hypothetical protein POM88_021211 [Heracleum sosnowskyi]|uniref:Uncharacterized protein n=1 Tax=Heracleum sosnowskyi TaxID=360622 RepID=A0AAD8MS96_9APIA|nr:hypothetical protein POM88_021211 [Heracleum sosnowskyi]
MRLDLTGVLAHQTGQELLKKFHRRKKNDLNNCRKNVRSECMLLTVRVTRMLVYFWRPSSCDSSHIFNVLAQLFVAGTWQVDSQLYRMMEVEEPKPLQGHMPSELQTELHYVADLVEKKADEHHTLHGVPKLLNPKLEENFTKGIDNDPDCERAVGKKLGKLLKCEAKGAAREPRKIIIYCPN